MSYPIKISESETVGSVVFGPTEKDFSKGITIVAKDAEILSLQQQLAAKQKLIEFACCDSADDDTRIRSLALTCGVTQEQLDSDPSLIGVVEMIVAKCAEKDAKIERLMV